MGRHILEVNRIVHSVAVRVAAAAAVAIIVLIAGSGRTQRADAAFHIAHINEAMFGANGNPNVQFVEIQMLSSGQTIIRGTRLSYWNADGSFGAVILTVPSSPTIQGTTNGTWLMASSGYAAASGVEPDFTFSPVTLPATGMLCWGAPGVVPEFPPTWDAADPLNYVDCLPYGGYTGAAPGTIRMGPATALGPGDGATQSLSRTQDTDNASADYVYACATPRSNNGGTGFNHDGDFIEFGALKSFDDATWPMSDATPDCSDADDDNDGITDANELSGAACTGQVTDPLRRDSDGDNYLDGAECTIGTNPNSIASKPTNAQCGAGTDTDGDGVLTQREVCFYNTDPNNINTDGDACRDGREIASVNANASVDVIDLQQVAGEAGAYAMPGNAVKVDYDTNKNGTLDVIDLQFVAARSGACP